MTSSRDDILRRIDLARVGMNTLAPERNYDTLSTLSRNELLDLLEDRILDYRATFIRTKHVPSAISNILAEYNLSKIIIPGGLPTGWSTGSVDKDFSPRELDEFDAVITSSEVAIAVTGTIILNHSHSNQGRRAISLVPDTHICVVKDSNVVGTVVEAVRRLNPKDHQTWISGPSATSDIELERVEGVHGPRNLHVILDLN